MGTLVALVSGLLVIWMAQVLTSDRVSDPKERRKMFQDALDDDTTEYRE